MPATINEVLVIGVGVDDNVQNATESLEIRSVMFCMEIHGGASLNNGK